MQISQILAVGRGVLADENEFAHTMFGKPLRLVYLFLRLTGDERTAKGRNGAE